MIIFGNTSQRVDAATLTNFIARLPFSGEHIVIEPIFFEYLISNGGTLPSHCIPGDACGNPGPVLSIGGDGTLLRAAAWSACDSLPLLGINTGHLGYLTAYTLDDIDLLRHDLLENNIVVEQRAMLHVECELLLDQVWPYAVNEVGVIKADTSAMIDIRTDIDGIYLNDYLADGLLVSTPTGSTGYSLSVGGPILQPTLGCNIITPVAPHTLTMRPLVVDGKSEISLFVTGRASSFRLSLDGRSTIIPCGTEIKITTAPLPLRLMRRANQDFAFTLRSKLSWGQR